MTALGGRPRIAIPVPTSGDFEYNRRSWMQYATAVERSGGEPVEVALGASLASIVELVKGCEGVVLPGSPADVNPRLYGQEAIEECAPADPAREEVDRLLLEDAFDQGKPVLAICFGTQMLNVWSGGTLVQDLTCVPVNHAAGRSVAVAHSAAVVPGSVLGALLGVEEAPLRDGYMWLPINSSHHQAVGVPGDGLRVCARSSEDGVIEAVEGDGGSREQFVLGIQWHPERSFEESAASRAIFGRLVAEAAAWVPSAAETAVA